MDVTDPETGDAGKDEIRIKHLPSFVIRFHEVRLYITASCHS